MRFATDEVDFIVGLGGIPADVRLLELLANVSHDAGVRAIQAGATRRSALRRSASRSGFERAPPSAPAAERGRELIAPAELQAEIAALEARLVWGSHHRRRRHRPGPRWPRIDLLGLRRERSSMGQPK